MEKEGRQESTDEESSLHACAKVIRLSVSKNAHYGSGDEGEKGRR